MFCRKCGTDNPDDSAFCQSCGAAFSASATARETGSAEGSFFGSLPPTTVIGDYEIDCELGEGGMGMVFNIGKHMLGGYLRRGGGQFSTKARSLLKKAEACSGTSGGCTESSFLQ